MKEIKITEGHFYLEEYDISGFVIPGSIDVQGDERVLIILQGKVKDERKKKKVKRGRKNST